MMAAASGVRTPGTLDFRLDWRFQLALQFVEEGSYCTRHRHGELLHQTVRRCRGRSPLVSIVWSADFLLSVAAEDRARPRFGT